MVSTIRPHRSATIRLAVVVLLSLCAGGVSAGTYILDTPVLGFVDDAAPGDSVFFAAPAGSHFRIVGGKESTSPYLLVRFTKVGADDAAAYDRARSEALDLIYSITGGAQPVDANTLFDTRLTSANRVVTDHHYRIRKELLQDHRYNWLRGLVWGGLIVPYKLFPSDGGGTGSATVGGFAGYRTRDVTFLGSLGGTGINTAEVNEDDGTTKFGASFAGGVVWQLGKDFQIGAIAGIDHILSSNPNWKYQDKLWVSIGVGFSFAR